MCTNFFGEGEGEVVVFIAKRWDHRNSKALIESANTCHDAQEVLVRFEPRPPDSSSCKVGGLQHGATTPSIFWE